MYFHGSVSRGGVALAAELNAIRGKYLHLSSGPTTLRSVVWNPLVAQRRCCYSWAFLGKKNEGMRASERTRSRLPEGENSALALKQKTEGKKCEVPTSQGDLRSDSFIYKCTILPMSHFT